MRIFTLPPAAETPPGFYDSLKKVRLRQQLEMYSIGEAGGRVRASRGGGTRAGAMTGAEV